MKNFLDNDIKFISGVGEVRARVLEKEAGIRTIGDMLAYYPFRYVDRTKIYRMADVTEDMASALVQLRGRVTGVSYAGAGRKRRFSVWVTDGTGTVELLWF